MAKKKTTEQRLMEALSGGAPSDEVIEEALSDLPDDKFRLAVYAAAEAFSRLKKEAIRRGIWEDLKKKKT